MTRSDKVRRLLGPGPATVPEIAAALCIPLRRAQVAVWILTSQGFARHTDRTKPSESGGRRHAFYELTPRGRAKLC